MQEIQKTTKFSSCELKTFRVKFDKLCSSESNELQMKDFVRFMRMMGVQSSNTLIHRIYKVIDFDQNGSISFEEFIHYFNILLNGDQSEKAELTFLTIAAGREDNLLLPKSEKKIDFKDIFEMIKLIQLEDNLQNEEEVDEEVIHEIASKMMGLLGGVDKSILLEEFKVSVTQDQKTHELFQVMGNGLKALMAYEGENRYTRTVKILRLISSRYDVLLREIEELVKEVKFEKEAARSVGKFDGQFFKKGAVILNQLGSGLNINKPRNNKRVETLIPNVKSIDGDIILAGRSNNPSALNNSGTSHKDEIDNEGQINRRELRKINTSKPAKLGISNLISANSISSTKRRKESPEHANQCKFNTLCSCSDELYRMREIIVQQEQELLYSN